MKKKTWIIIGVILVVIVGVVLYFQYQAKQALANTQYETEAIEKGTLTAVVGATGSVRANQSAQIAWQADGTVDTVNVVLDTQVKADDVLAELDRTSLSQAIINAQADLVSAQQALEDLKASNVDGAQAELDLVNAKEDYKDAVADRALLDKPIKTTTWKMTSTGPHKIKTERDATQKEIDEANAKLSVAEAKLAAAQREFDRLKDGPDPQDMAVAEARVAAAQATINQATLKAPFSGTITDVDVKPGDIVSPGTQAFRLDDLSHLLVDVEVSEVDINQVKLGQKATLTFDGIPDKEYSGSVVEVARVGVDSGGVVSFTVTVEIDQPDEQVLPQMTSAVNIVTVELTDEILIPNRAVRMINGKRSVFILENNLPVLKEIELGSSNGTVSILRSGEVKVGDKIIINPSSTLVMMYSNTNGMMMGGR